MYQDPAVKSVIAIPTYNERDNIVPLITRCLSLPVHLDFFFIDDHSPDGTGELLDSLRTTYPRVRVMHRSGKLGLGSAYREAFRLLLKEPYECYITMDADLSHRPESIPDLLHAVNEADLVIGSRYCPGGGSKNWSLTRRLLSRTANQVARRLLGLTSMDSTSGFRCYRREVIEALDRLDVRSNGYSFLVEMAYYSQRMGFRIAEQPILFEERFQAKSKMSYMEIIKAVQTILRLVSHRLSGRRGLDRIRLAASGLNQKS